MKHIYPFLISGMLLILSLQSSAATFNGSVILTNTIQQVELEVTVNNVTGVNHFRLTGPLDRWFAFALNTPTMVGYTLVANSSDGLIVERTMLGIGAPGNVQPMQNLFNITSSSTLTTITIEFDRMNVTPDPQDYAFPATPTTTNVVYGVSSNPVTTFGYHGFGTMFRGPTVLTFAPLPIRMSVFGVAVDGNAGVLSWETASETNSLGFEVERSADAENWEKLAFVEGQGNSSSTSRYNYRDEQLMPGPNYYRVKMLDLDGSYEYSVIRIIDFSGPDINEDLLISPNPVFANMKISTDQVFEGTARVMIYNTAFQKVRDEFWTDSGSPIEFNLSELPAGPYFVYIKHNSWSAVQRIIKGG